MKRVLSRFVAYVIDMIIVSLIAIGLANIKYINPNIEKGNNLTENYLSIVNQYVELSKEFDNYLEDSILTEKEIEEITSKYPLYREFTYIDEYQPLDPVDSDLQTKMKDKIYDDYVNNVEIYNYKITRNNVYQSIILIVVSIFYFVILQFLMNGQTIGKKLMRLRVKSVDDKEVSIFSFFIRTILVCELLFTILDLVLVFSLKQSTYNLTASYIIQVRYLYELAFIICLIIRDDNRSLHDLLLKTKVVRYDKAGNEIEETLFNKNEETEENALIDEDEVVEKKTKKKTNSKNTKNKKTFVEAEKVNDKKSTNKNN